MLIFPSALRALDRRPRLADFVHFAQIVYYSGNEVEVAGLQKNLSTIRVDTIRAVKWKSWRSRKVIYSSGSKKKTGAEAESAPVFFESSSVLP